MLQSATKPDASDDVTMVPLGQDYPEIRETIRAICEKYPGKYWRDLEDEHAYPEAFVKELGDAGFLAALIPEQYGGAGLPLRAGSVILEEIHASGCMANHCHAQIVHDGDAAAARQRRPKEALPLRHRRRQAALPVVRRDRAHHRVRRPPC